MHASVIDFCNGHDLLRFPTKSVDTVKKTGDFQRFEAGLAWQRQKRDDAMVPAIQRTVTGIEDV